MKPTTSTWIEYADGDMEVAEKLYTEGERMGHGYEIAVFHCHQAIEKVLKAILNEYNKEIPKIHDLVRLATLTEISIPDKLILHIKDLNPHYMPPRYPDLPFRPAFTFTYNKRNTTTIINNTRNIYLWLKKTLVI